MNAKAEFEICAKDVAGRIGRLKLNEKKLETPALMPVYNINKQVIPIKELKKEFGVEVLMTNAYMLLKDEKLKEKVEKSGIHKVLGFEGLVATDSGSFQLMTYGAVTTTNTEIIKFQERIGSDIGSFLDIPSLPDSFKPRVSEQLDETIKRGKEAVDAKFLVNAGVQGGVYLDLRKQAATAISPDFQLNAVGGIVRLMEEYRFAELVDIIGTVRQNIPADRIVHAFGLGHPMVFSLATLLGCDLFDSAAYALFAQQGRYLTEYGTEHLAELTYIPCNCPVCKKHGEELKELEEEEKIKELAHHNLYVSMTEMARVKQAILEGSLWELTATRCRAHPRLLSGLKRLKNHSKWMSERDPITKKSAFFYTGPEAEDRTEVINAKQRLARVSSDNLTQMPPFGEVPAELSEMYPFASTIVDEENQVERSSFRIREIEKIRAQMDYQFGAGASDAIPDWVRIKRSRKTKRIRWIYEEKEMIASVRASDHMIIPHEKLAKRLHEKFPKPKLRIVVDDEAVPFIKEGLSVFAKFVLDIDPDLRPGDEVLVVDSKDNFLKVATLHLSPQECQDFERGMAARVR